MSDIEQMTYQLAELVGPDQAIECVAQGYDVVFPGLGDVLRTVWLQVKPELFRHIPAPIFDRLVADMPGLLCPLCGKFEPLGLCGGDEGDMEVCFDCFMRNLHRPEWRAEQTCTACGKYCFGLDAHVLVVADKTIPLCREHYHGWFEGSGR